MTDHSISSHLATPLAANFADIDPAETAEWRDAFLALSDPAQLRALRALKAALDPSNIFNPGKVL